MEMKEIEWQVGDVAGCDVRLLRKYADKRGWLAEYFRSDEIPRERLPVMGYLSLTHAGVSRGPHEHRGQTDLFLFFHGRFRLYVWDTREDSPTCGYRQSYDLGEENPAAVFIPPGVVHAYRNLGEEDAYIVNCPNRLYGGHGRGSEVDEIRYEHLEDSPFVLY